MRGTLVGARNQRRPAHPQPIIAAAKLVNKVFTRNAAYVVIPSQAQHWRVKVGDFAATICFNSHAQQRGIFKHSRVATLPRHFVQRKWHHLQSVARQYTRIERRTLFKPHGRQLRTVTEHDKAATIAAVHIVYKVVEQTPSAKHRPSIGISVGHHRGFIDNEYSIGVLVLGHIEASVVLRAVTLLAVNLSVNGVRRMSCIFREHLRGPASRSEQHRFHAKGRKRLYQRTSKRCFARTSISVKQQQPIAATRHTKTCKTSNKLVLLIIGLIFKELKQGDSKPHFQFIATRQHCR